MRIPIHLGPQTTVYDLAFDGNRAYTDAALAAVADLELGAPLANAAVEAARLRLLDTYRDGGFAYVDVQTSVEPSPDRTRARVRFSVSERERVIVEDFVIKGARLTDHDLVLGRVALRRGAAYTQGLVRLSEERIASLGTFSSVAVGLENPEVPQRRKRVVITVVEPKPQYIDTLLGFSTGEGVRFGFEVGHKNLAGYAISAALRLQFGYLFDFMILDPAVRTNLAPLQVLDRLERRNALSIDFPEIGLGPLIGLSLLGVDLRNNQRDFGLTKDAVLPTLTYRPRRAIAVQLGASVERNDVTLFRSASIDAAIRQNQSLANLLRVPQGCTLALGQRLQASWDRRDNPLAATKGTFVAAGVEHVTANPIGATGCLEASDGPAGETAAERQAREAAEIDAKLFDSHFLRLTATVNGYLRLTPRGLAIAMSLSGGYNLQLDATSKTYPDRLFFMGGFGSHRAFLDDSLVPEDLAQRILYPERYPDQPTITIRDVGVRGGDVYLNPRLELRIPVVDLVQAGLFVDAGNLWVDPDQIDLLALRVGVGAGVRIETPFGMAALDYGINVVKRPWEDRGALHLAVGLF